MDYDDYDAISSIWELPAGGRRESKQESGHPDINTCIYVYVCRDP